MFDVYSFRILKYATPTSIASYTCYSNYYLVVDDHNYIAMRLQFFWTSVFGEYTRWRNVKKKKEDNLSFISTIGRRKVQSVKINTESLCVAHTSFQQSDAFRTKLNKLNKKFLDSVYENKPL